VDPDRLFERAVNPCQYDEPDLAWDAAGADVREAHLWPFLAPLAPMWRERSLIDIGSGTGWLVARAAASGATRVCGIDPSRTVVRAARARYPRCEFHHSALECFSTDERFDVALMVMVLSHVRDPGAAFRAVRRLLTPTGELHALVDAYSDAPMAWETRRVHLGPGEAVVLLDHPRGVLADVLRDTSVYEDAGARVGLSLIERTPLYVRDEAVPAYERLRFSGEPRGRTSVS
jgi:SAM-dependent methyltransferase